MTKLTDLTITEALKGLKNKDFTAVEVTQAHIDAMGAAKDLNAYITETPDQALAQAAESDKRYAEGNARDLDGIPIAMKDLFCTKDVQTTAASHILEGFTPQYESTVSQKLLDAGTITLGKANLDEFAVWIPALEIILTASPEPPMTKQSSLPAYKIQLDHPYPS